MTKTATPPRLMTGELEKALGLLRDADSLELKGASAEAVGAPASPAPVPL